MNRDSLMHYSQKALKSLPMDNQAYNDILDILSFQNLPRFVLTPCLYIRERGPVFFRRGVKLCRREAREP